MSDNSALGAVPTGPSGPVGPQGDVGPTYAPADNEIVPAKIAFSATDKVLGRSTAGAGAGEEIAVTAAGRALIDDASASAQRTTLGLGTAAVSATGDFDAAGVASAAVSTHAGLSDPHTGYRLESADHSHASTGLQAGQLAQANTHQSPDTDAAAGSLHHTIGAGAAQVVGGTDARLTDARTPTAHGTTHDWSGTDPVIHEYAVGTFTLADGQFAIFATQLILTSSQVVTLQGTATLRIL